MHESKKTIKSLVKEDLTVHCSLVGALAIDAWALLCEDNGGSGKKKMVGQSR